MLKRLALVEKQDIELSTACTLNICLLEVSLRQIGSTKIVLNFA
jgi:hypothetical protein